ncbi:MAG TPA: hypothetical protein VFE29_04040 [Terriglobia bacterium]|nr:hypothetical protein [Terriglobia bacterium]
MKHQNTSVLTVMLWWAIAGTQQAAAQEANSFEQLQVLVKPGDTVVVIDKEGRSTKGKVQNISRESLHLKSGGNVREFAQRDAVEIKKRQADSLANGAIIGAVAGGAFGSLGAIAVCNEGCDGDGGTVAAVIGIYAGMGAAIGVGIDALIKPRRTIYRSPGQSALSNIHVAPLIGGGRRGVALKWSF